ncbi:MULTISPECIES: hypothetical protein [Methanohalophilus]|jgi:hypothetical protein|nr:MULTISPECIES: hypothetical protein [Methanohalophilus]
MRVRFIAYLADSIAESTENHAGKEETSCRAGEQVTEHVTEQVQ